MIDCPRVMFHRPFRCSRMVSGVSKEARVSVAASPSMMVTLPVAKVAVYAPGFMNSLLKDPLFDAMSVYCMISRGQK